MLAFRILALLSALTLAGCAAPRLEREGLELIDAGRIEEGMLKLEEAVKADPDDTRYRLALHNARDRLTTTLLTAADRALAAGNNREAGALYRRVLTLDAQNIRATEGLRAVDRERSAADFVRQGEDALKRGELGAAERYASSALALNKQHPQALALRARIDEARSKELVSFPQLKSKLSRPVSLEFRDANLKMVFDVLAKTSGLNFLFDKDVRADTKVTIFVKQVAVEDAIDLLLVQSQLEKKVINENSLLIYPDTPQKLKEFQDLVIRSFYLANADAKQTLNMIKTILKTKDVYIDEKLNLLVMRDTPDAIRIAEKLISVQDVAEAEVVLEVEVLEFTRTDDTNFGVTVPDFIDYTASVRDNYNLRGPETISGRLNFRHQIGNGRILANPRLRIKNKEKARILIGDRVPIINSTATPTTTGAGGALTTTIIAQSVQYLDVGLKLELEPVVHLDGEVMIKINLEVSTLGDSVQDNQGNTIAFRVGTRTANTVLQIREGDTSTIMGLIRNDEITTTRRVPGLGEIPIIGRLFSNVANTNTRTEVALSITPRVVRNVQAAGPDISELVSGTEGSLRAKPLTTRPVGDKDAVALRGTGSPAPAAPAARPPAAAAAQPPVPQPAAPAEGPLTLEWVGATDARVGQEFQVTLRAAAQEPMVSAAIQVGYDAAAFKVVEVTEGDLLKRDGAQTTFTNRIDAASGKVFIGLSRAGAGGSGASGDGALVNIKFAAQAEKPKSPIQVLVFSGVGPANRLLQSALPAPLEVNVAP